MANKSWRKSLEGNKQLPPEESSENSEQQKKKAADLPLQDAIYPRKDNIRGSIRLVLLLNFSLISKGFPLYSFLISLFLNQYPYIRSN